MDLTGAEKSSRNGESGHIVMALDISALRTADEDFPDVKERIATLIRIGGKQVIQAVSVTDKRELFISFKPADTLLAVRTVEWRSDVFQTPKTIRARWKKELLGPS